MVLNGDIDYWATNDFADGVLSTAKKWAEFGVVD